MTTVYARKAAAPAANFITHLVAYRSVKKHRRGGYYHRSGNACVPPKPGQPPTALAHLRRSAYNNRAKLAAQMHTTRARPRDSRPVRRHSDRRPGAKPLQSPRPDWRADKMRPAAPLPLDFSAPAGRRPHIPARRRMAKGGGHSPVASSKAMADMVGAAPAVRPARRAACDRTPQGPARGADGSMPARPPARRPGAMPLARGAGAARRFCRRFRVPVAAPRAQCNVHGYPEAARRAR